jgi:predicted nucleic acid-binding protein
VYLLDTNILSQVLRKHPRQTVIQHLRQTPSETIHASIITFFEMRYGSMLREDADRFWSRIESQILPLVKWIPIEQRVAFEAGAVAAKLRNSGRSIGFADCLIAACAMAHDI